MTLGRTFLCLAIALSAPLLTGAIGRTSNLEDRLLAAHNRERATAGVPPLAWDDTLAADAQAWANNLAARGAFQHSPDDPDADPQGENLWAGTPDAWSPEEMVGLWIAEKADYAPGPIPAVSKSGDFEKVGHYTQLIWRNTQRVGCAVAKGAKEEILVCRYSAAGNVIGEQPA
ncbi:CAP domain-containing protein [Sphingomonas tabacisoli]|uniref:CAP domain-containing protein n=1 Tax=Sphingomonas tabacisoli TaxID=2249466 RepID=A0ABW4HZ05_9SPHN